jgi:hypothetical protein
MSFVWWNLGCSYSAVQAGHASKVRDKSMFRDLRDPSRGMDWNKLASHYPCLEAEGELGVSYRENLSGRLFNRSRSFAA